MKKNKRRLSHCEESLLPAAAGNKGDEAIQKSEIASPAKKSSGLAMTALLQLLILILVVGGIGYWAVHFGPFSKSETKAKKGARYYCPMHPTYTSDRPGDCPICNMRLVPRDDRGAEGEKKERKILFYRHPMGQPDTSPAPKKDSMGMDYIPVYEDELMSQKSSVPGYAGVQMSLERQQLIGVKTAPLEIRKLVKTVRAVGTVAHDPELYQAQAEYLEALKALERARQSTEPEITEQAERLVDSTRIRLRHLGLNEELIQEIAGRKTPDHGLLIGQSAEPVWVYAEFYEYELPLLKVGAEVTAEAPSLPGQSFHGKVRSLDPMVEPMTRTVRARIQLENPDGLLRPDLYLNVALAADLGEVLTVPESAVFDTGMKKIVFAAKGEGLFEPREVVTGPKADGFYEVKSGLSAGESVVTSGNFLIDSESRLKAAIEGAGEGGVHQHG